MIRSMTAFGSARVDAAPGTVSVEIRGVNNRFLDLSLRLPDDLRFAEPALRQLISANVARGKLDVRLSCKTSDGEASALPLDMAALHELAGHLRLAREIIPDVAAPSFAELPRLRLDSQGNEPASWLEPCLQACTLALDEFNANREREGDRLAQAMLALAGEALAIGSRLEAGLPAMVQQHHEKLTQRLQETLAGISPDGFAAISGPELSARIAQEASLFSLRADIAEELTRLQSHLAELQQILSSGPKDTPSQTRGKGCGKRLDFLFQEMNREANTLGSKAASLAMTQAAIDLKLLIEQMREQAQNIE